MTRIKDIVGIDTHAVERLTLAGVRTLDQLIERGASSAARIRLADETQLDDAAIKNWVHQADLMRIKGVGPSLAHLLCEAGVCTAPKLAYRDSNSLYVMLLDHNQATRDLKSVPDAHELHSYITSAKQLPKLIRH